MKANFSSGNIKPARARYPEEEAKFPWLPLILEAYAIIDKGVSSALKRAKKNGFKLACKRGCANCCGTHTDIPLYPLEAVGIYWFCAEKLDRSFKERLKKQLSSHAGRPPCPFLIEDSCSIHPLRPIACRQFNVFGKPCAPGEDPFFTRREDVLTPIKDYTDRAFYTMLPFYGLSGEAERQQAVKNNYLHSLAVNLQTYDWKKLAGLISASGKNPED